MPIRPSSFSSKGVFTPKAKAPTSIPYLLQDDGSIDDDSSDFSFEIEEEVVNASPKRNNRIATVKQTNRDGSVQSRNNALLESLRTDSSRGVQRSFNNKVVQKAAVSYTAGPARASNDESIISDDDFSISVASETDGLMSAVVNSSSKNTKSNEVAAMQPGASRISIEQSRLKERRINARDDTSTLSSKTAIQSLMEKLSSKEDTSVSTKSTQNMVKRKELFLGKPDAPSTTSRAQSLKSKAAGSIDYAESIVKSHSADIEHGASTTSSTSCSSGKLSSRFWGKTGDGTLEGQKMVVSSSGSSKRRSTKRKICCGVGFILIAAAGTVGALIGLDVIFKGTFKAKTNPSSETPEPEPETTLTVSNIDLTWYVDWDAFQCVMDCNGRPPCGGTKTNNDGEMYASLRDCCSKGMVDFIDEQWHWTVELCMEQTAVETVLPTYSPTVAQEEETAEPTTHPQVSTPFPTAVSNVMYFADNFRVELSLPEV